MEDRVRGLADMQKEILEKVRGISNGQDGNQAINVMLGGGESVKGKILSHAFTVVLVLCGVMFLLYLDLSRKFDRMQDHLTAIYMMAPDLQPKPNPPKE